MNIPRPIGQASIFTERRGYPAARFCHAVDGVFGATISRRAALWSSAMTETMVEIAPIADIYADDIGAIELIGENVRIVFYTEQNGEKVVCCKLVRPVKSVQGRLLCMVETRMATAK